MVLAEPTHRDWWDTAVRVIVFVAVLLVSATTMPSWVPVGVAVVGLSVLVRWHARTYGYRCPVCSAEFTMKPLQDAIAVSWFSGGHVARRVRCPSCGVRRFMRVLAVRTKL